MIDRAAENRLARIKFARGAQVRCSLAGEKKRDRQRPRFRVVFRAAETPLSRESFVAASRRVPRHHNAAMREFLAPDLACEC